jgi:hypothetical protein
MRSKKAQLPSLIILLIVIIVFYFLDKSPSPDNNQPTPTQPPVATLTAGGVITPTAGVPEWGVRTKTSGCKVQGVFPDPACTPGDLIKPLVSKEDICVSGYASSVRNVTDSVKNAVYAEYGITSRSPGEYEVDHYVSLELGGSNDISNLFPEAANPKPGCHEKDRVENYLHDQVCKGAITLEDAQIKIATNWLEVYNSLPK